MGVVGRCLLDAFDLYGIGLLLEYTNEGIPYSNKENPGLFDSEYSISTSSCLLDEGQKANGSLGIGIHGLSSGQYLLQVIKDDGSTATLQFVKP